MRALVVIGPLVLLGGACAEDVGALPAAADHAASSCGERFAAVGRFGTPADQVMVFDACGTRPVARGLVSSAATEAQVDLLAFDPNGRQLAFARRDAAGVTVFVARTDIVPLRPGAPVVAFEDGWTVAAMVWSASGEQLAVHATGPTEDRLTVVRADGSVTDLARGVIRRTQWAPTRARLFWVGRGLTVWSPQGAIEVARDISARSNVHWLDDETIVYEHPDDAEAQAFVVAPFAGARSRRFFTGRSHLRLRLHPSAGGRRVALAYRGHGQIATFEDGAVRAIEPLIPSQDPAGTFVNWHPRRAAYLAWRDGALVQVELDEAEPVVVSVDAGRPAAPVAATWSAEGRWVAVQWADEVVAYDLAAGGRSPIAVWAGATVTAAPAGDRFIFEDPSGLVSAELDGPVTTFDDAGRPLGWRAEGRTLYYASSASGPFVLKTVTFSRDGAEPPQTVTIDGEPARLTRFAQAGR